MSSIRLSKLELLRLNKNRNIFTHSSYILFVDNVSFSFFSF